MAAAEKFKTKKLSAASRKVYERAAAAAEKKAVAAEEQAKAGGLGAGAMAAAAATAREARARADAARDRLAAAVPSERHAASGRLGKAVQLSGRRVADKAPTRDDREMVAEAERARAPWEDALEEMRRRGKGWMHSREVRGKAVVVLVDDPRSDRSRWTWYCEGGCGSADVLAKFTAHEAIIMGKAGEEWFTIDDRHLKNGRLRALRAALGCVEEDDARGAAAASGSAAAVWG